jgi:RimJ/RimL family protein N-acetyltransferase
MPPPLKAAAGLGISYRPIADADLPFLDALYVSTRAEEVAMTGWPAEMQRQFLAQQFDAQHRHYMRHYPDAEWLVVERAGRAIGRLYMEDWPSQIRIIDISLLPDSRGHGIGRAILEDVIDFAAGMGKLVSIHVEKNNSARRLYDRLGFRKAGDEGVYDRLEWSPEAGGDAS